MVEMLHSVAVTWIFILWFSNRWPGLHPSRSCCSFSGDSSSPAPGRSHQISASQSQPVRSASPGLQLEPSTRGPPGSLWLCQELQCVLRLLGPLCWQHTEWPLQDSSPWVHSLQICWRQMTPTTICDFIFTVYSLFPACVCYLFGNTMVLSQTLNFSLDHE